MTNDESVCPGKAQLTRGERSTGSTVFDPAYQICQPEAAKAYRYGLRTADVFNVKEPDRCPSACLQGTA
jgi:hypothetical protein